MNQGTKLSHIRGRKGTGRIFKDFFEKSRLGDLLILKGLVSPVQLKEALQYQKTAALPLGQILLEHKVISRRQLHMVLARQTILRSSAAALLCVMMIMGMTGKRARAEDGVNPLSIQIAFTAASAQNYQPMAATPRIFDSEEKRSANLQPFTKWNAVFEKLDRQVANGQATPVAAEWRESLKGAQNLSLKDMAAKVNSIMNAKPYIEDNRNWGVSDYWETPVEFMQRGGDCEDFAIAKYSALRALGVPDDRMRVAIVQDTLKNIPHAILIVYTNEGPFILDNQIKTLVDASSAGRYRPIFSINRTAWWLHTPSNGTQVASR